MAIEGLAAGSGQRNARARFPSDEVLGSGDVACVLKCGEMSAQIAVRNAQDRSQPGEFHLPTLGQGV